MYTMGLDIGSAAAKCLILRDGRDVVGCAVAAAGIGTSGPKRARLAALEQAGIEPEALACTVATGYGRRTFHEADFSLSELSCHAAGAQALYPGVRTVVDIGGQDAKVLHVSADGGLENFLMNDKCAAGTGRFLEVMARVLELEVGELEEMGRGAKPAPISSTCTVFAESEVISQLAADADIHELVAGIHASVAVRAASLARRLGLRPPVVMTGGVAQNGGVVEALERELGLPVAVPPLAQLAGAYGAALCGWRRKERERER